MRKIVTGLAATLACLIGCASTAPPGRLVATTPGTAASTSPASSDAAPAQAGGDGVAAKAAEDRPRADGPWIGAAGASDLVMAGTHDTFLGVWVDVPTSADRARAPMAVSLVIDTSGSMAGSKIQNARTAARDFIRGLPDGDIVSLETFSDRAEERIAPTELRAESRRAILAAIDALDVSGGTNLFDGLRFGEARASMAPASHPVRRVVLISDGKATVGPTTTDLLGELAERGMERGVQVTAIGVGLDYDEHTLNTLAVRSSGRLHHLTEPHQLASILSNEMRLLQGTMATSAFVEIAPAPGVTILGIEGSRSESMGSGVRVPLGTMFGGQRRELLVRVRVSAQTAGSHPLASVRLHFQDATDHNVPRVQEVVARYEVTNDAAQVASRSHSRTQTIVATQQAAQASIRAAERVNADNFDDADKELAKAEVELRDKAKFVKSAPERARLEQAAASISSTRSATKAAAAAPAPAKRARALDLNAGGMKAAGF